MNINLHSVIIDYTAGTFIPVYYHLPALLVDIYFIVGYFIVIFGTYRISQIFESSLKMETNLSLIGFFFGLLIIIVDLLENFSFILIKSGFLDNYSQTDLIWQFIFIIEFFNFSKFTFVLAMIIILFYFILSSLLIGDNHFRERFLLIIVLILYVFLELVGLMIDPLIRNLLFTLGLFAANFSFYRLVKSYQTHNYKYFGIGDPDETFEDRLF